MIEVNWGELESIQIPCSQPRGITYDGSTLWISDEAEQKLYRLKPDSGRVQYSFKYSGMPGGLSWDGKNLWQTDVQDKKIDKLNRRGKVSTSIKLDRAETLSGLTFDGRYLWQAEYSGLWYKIDLSVDKVENAYKWGHHVCGIAHDGKEFWYLEDETPALHQISQLLGMNQKSYRIDGQPRGLAWDGQCFWIVDAAANVLKKFTP